MRVAVGIGWMIAGITVALSSSSVANQTDSASAYDAFVRAEATLNAEIVSARQTGGETDVLNAVLRLAAHYSSNDLHAEAFGVLTSVDIKSAELRARTADAAFSAGFFQEAAQAVNADTIAHAPSLRRIRANASARLGACAAANSDFAAATELSDAGQRRIEDIEAELICAIVVESAERAKALLAEFDRATASEPFGASEYFRGRIDVLSGEDALAASRFDKVAKTGEEPWVTRAAVAGARLRVSASSGDIDAMILRDADGWAWREAMMVKALRAEGEENLTVALETYASIVRRHPMSDAARRAELHMRRLLPTIFVNDADASPVEQAQLFFEYIDYAPPGTDGDALIRRAAARLVALDLNDLAAKMLEHQVFERLRGEERARVAADLARIYADQQQFEEAIRVIAETRFASQDAALMNDRLLIEARTLDALGRGDEALARLDGAEHADALTLAADIHWRRKDWREAARRYVAAYAQIDHASSKATHLFARGGASYAAAAEFEALSNWLNAARAERGDTAEFAMLAALLEQDASNELEAETGIDDFLDHYQSTYSSTDERP